MSKYCKVCGNEIAEEVKSSELREFKLDGKDCWYFDTYECLAAYVLKKTTKATGDIIIRLPNRKEMRIVLD